VCSLTAEKGVIIVIMAQTFGPVYDTHAAVRRLTEAGIPEPQAEAVVREQTHILEHNLATKADIETLRQETKAGIGVAKTELIKWVVGTNLGVVAIVIAALKLI